MTVPKPATEVTVPKPATEALKLATEVTVPKPATEVHAPRSPTEAQVSIQVPQAPPLAVLNAHCRPAVEKTGEQESGTPQRPNAQAEALKEEEQSLTATESEGSVTSAPMSPEGQCQFILEPINENTWKARLRRVMKPRRDGSYLVPKDLVDMYNNSSTQANVYTLFQKSNYNPVSLQQTIMTLYYCYICNTGLAVLKVRRNLSRRCVLWSSG